MVNSDLETNKQQKQQPNSNPVVSEIFETVVFDQLDKDLYSSPGGDEGNDQSDGQQGVFVGGEGDGCFDQFISGSREHGGDCQ